MVFCTPLSQPRAISPAHNNFLRVMHIHVYCVHRCSPLFYLRTETVMDYRIKKELVFNALSLLDVKARQQQ